MRTRVLITNFFRIEIHQSRANLWRFFDFQAIALVMAIKSVLFQLGVITISFCDQIGQLPRHAVMVRLNLNGALEHCKNLKAILTENIDER